MSGWDDFLRAYHEAHPGITEDLLRPMRGPGGLQPYAWLAEGLPPTGPVWDVCCGSAPVADVVGRDRYEGVDLSEAELAEAAVRRPGTRVRHGDAMTTDPVHAPVAVTVAMALMLLPLPAFLARAASLLPVGGRLQAVVPTRENAGSTGYATLLRLLGQSGVGYRQALAPEVVRAALDAAGFALVDDEVTVFDRELTPDDVDLVAASFYVRHPGAGDDAARRWLSARSAEPGFRLDYPLRRLRAVRVAGPPEVAPRPGSGA